MPSEIYQLVAQAARYWFLFLMLLIVFRSYRWYRRDKKSARKRLKLLPDAGYVGELLVMKETGSLHAGDALMVSFEGSLGSLRTNDICLPVAGVRGRHLWFHYEEGKGLFVEGIGRHRFGLDDPEQNNHKGVMLHGSRLYVGEAELCMRFFAGFEAGDCQKSAQRAEDFAADAAPQMQPQMTPAQQQAAYQQWYMQQWMMQQHMAQQAAYQQWVMQMQNPQFQAQYQEAYQSWMQARQEKPSMAEAAQAQSGCEPPLDEANEEEAYEMPDTPEEQAAYLAWMQSHRDGLHVQTEGVRDDSVFMRPKGETTESAAPENGAEMSPPQPPPVTEFETDETFYAPEPAEEDIYDSDVIFDEDMTDAAVEMPKSAYVGQNESEKITRDVWDKYFGGGRRQ